MTYQHIGGGWELEDDSTCWDDEHQSFQIYVMAQDWRKYHDEPWALKPIEPDERDIRNATEMQANQRDFMAHVSRAMSLPHAALAEGGRDENDL